MARQQEAKPGAFFLLKNHNGLWLFRAVFSSRDSRCLWMVQHTFCHFYRLCSTIMSQTCKWIAEFVPVLIFFPSYAREYKGKNAYIMERECKRREFLLFVTWVLFWYGRRWQSRIRYFSFQLSVKKQSSACCWKIMLGRQLQNCWEGFLRNPQHEEYDHATKSCVSAWYVGTC